MNKTTVIIALVKVHPGRLLQFSFSEIVIC